MTGPDGVSGRKIGAVIKPSVRPASRDLSPSPDSATISRAVKTVALASCLLLLACSRGGRDGNDDALLNAGETDTTLTPGTQPVRIGEGGPSFAACATDGKVVNISADGETYLPVRAAPFANAAEVARLGDGARLFVCTRSIDQGWLGVVVQPAAQPRADCGVAAPVGAVRGYAGPCASGWVSSAFVRLIAD